MSSLKLIVLASFSIGVIQLTSSNISEENKDRELALSVGRRSSSDVYVLPCDNGELDNKACNTDDNNTYLVDENQCISNQQLLNECSFVLAPAGELNTSRLAFNIQMNVPFTSTTGQTTNASGRVTTALVINKSTRLPVNNSTCHISNLEVYRGRERTFRISQDGFYLSNNGTIVIHAEQLLHGPEEYEGELYRMNLSCSGGGLPESGCLFFKVIGRTDITDAKFNCTVPGTKPTNSSNCTLPDMTIATPSSSNGLLTSIPLTVSTMITNRLPTTAITEENPGQVGFEIGSPLFYSVVGIGGGAIVILSCMIVACIVVYIGCKRECKCASNNSEEPLYEDIQESLAVKTIETEVPNYAQIGSTYQELQEFIPGAKNPSFQEWEMKTVTLSNRDDEQGHPPNEYNTLMQVGGRQWHKPHTETGSASDDQYAQLHRYNMHDIEPHCVCSQV